MKYTGMIFGDLLNVALSHGLKPVDDETLEELKERLFSLQVVTPRGTKVCAGKRLKGAFTSQLGDVRGPSADGKWLIWKNFDPGVPKSKRMKTKARKIGKFTLTEIDQHFLSEIKAS